MPTNISAEAVLDLVKNRRTYYPLNKELTLTPARIEEIVKEALLHVPSSFNSQWTRVVVLFGAEHDKLWDFTAKILEARIAPEHWEPTGQKMAMFKMAAGTILFFEDDDDIKHMATSFPSYAENFPTWATQSDGMLQFTIWVSLEAEGLGANLQHYNPIIDEKIAAEWKIPSSWRLNAQMVFGGRGGPALEKTFKPLEVRYKAFGV